MARYRKIDPRMWGDERFVALRPEEKLIAVYVITAQSNRIGMFRFSPAMAAEQLGMLPQTFREGFANVCRMLCWGFDESVRVLYMPTWWKYNLPENPNVLKSCMQDLHELPQSKLIADFASNLEHLPQTFHQTFREGLPKPSPKRMPNQEQEQEQEQEPHCAGVIPASPGQTSPEAMEEHDAGSFARNWLTVNLPSCLRSAPVMARMVSAAGRDEAVRRVQAAAAVPGVSNPVAYAEKAMDGERAKTMAAKAAAVPTAPKYAKTTIFR